MGKGGVWSMAHLRVGENRRRNDLVGAEGLPRVDERGQDLAALFAFRCLGSREVNSTIFVGGCKIVVTESSGTTGTAGRKGGLTRHRRRQRIVDADAHDES